VQFLDSRQEGGAPAESAPNAAPAGAGPEVGGDIDPDDIPF
jgi:hypothetical protein